MAISNVELIRRSLTLINVLGVEEAAEPEQSKHALISLNQILAEWEADGVNLQYYEQSVDDLPGDCPIPPDAELAVTHYLAIAEAPHYGRPVSGELQALAAKYYNRIMRKSVSEKLKAVKSNLPSGEGQLSTGNILTG